MKNVYLLLFLLLAGGAAMAQTRVLTGFVRDSATNSPIQYATVRVQGQNTAATTGTDGGFSLNLSSTSANLEISYVGYTTQSVSVNENQTNVIILLGQSKSSGLSEVVVTALGISKDARKVGYAITTVNGDVLNKARESNVALSLEGRVAGLNVHGVNSGPGGTAKILLRGLPSINSSGAPLFVINGIPMDNSQRGSTNEWGGADLGDGIGNINPDDIETMTVLKGQAASALYGARASNGVILITTKSGKKGQFSIDYNTNFQLDKAIDWTDFQYVYGQGENGAKPTAATARNTTRLSWGAKLDGTQVPAFDGNSYAYSAVKDNIANFYRTAPSFTNTISVSNGTDKGNFRLSVSNLDGNSIVRNSGLFRKTANLTMEQKITDKLKVNLLANYVDEFSKNRPQLSDGPMNPNNGIFLATNVDENILKPGYDPVTGHEIQFSDDEYVSNPWFVVNQYINNLNRKRLISAVSARYDFTNWLYLQGRVGYDLINDRTFHVTPWGTAYATGGQAFKGQLDELSQTQRVELNTDALLGISHKIVSDINLDLALGANFRKNRYEETGVGGSPFVLPYLYSYSNVVNFNRSYDFSQSVVHSAYYTADISYKTVLTLSTTGRYDTYSTLPSSNRGIFTPSVAGSFVFSELLHSAAITYGKLRVSYAETSGEPGDAYLTSPYYGVGNAINGVPTGNYPGNLYNINLKPFTLDEFEVGANVKLFKNRLGFDVAYFDRKTHNEIQQASLSQTTGYNTRYVPTGSTQNKGIEVLVTGTPVQTKSFNWDVSLNFTNVANKILATDESNSILTLGTDRFNHGAVNTAFIVGKSGPQIMVHDYQYDSKGNIVVDASGLPVAGNLVSAGSVLPTFYGGLNNEFNFKGISLSFLFDFNYGNKILSSTKAEAIYRGLDKMTLEGRDGIKTGVYADGTTNTLTVSAESYYQKLSQNVQIFDVLNGDYIKLRQVTLGYTISEKVFSNIPVIRSLQLSLVGRNLATLLRKSDNIDPESTFGANIRYTGIDGTALPSTRTYGISANFKFK